MRVWFKHHGFSVVEALVATGLVGVLAVGSAGVMRQAYKSYSDNKDWQDRTAVGNYFLQFVDCQKTMADADYQNACKKNLSINLRDKDDVVILPAGGRDFEGVFVKNWCDGGDIYFDAVVKVPDPKPLLGRVPIVCGMGVPSNLSNSIVLKLVFAAKGKKLTIDTKFLVSSVVINAKSQAVATLTLVKDSLKSSLSGDFSTELADQLLKGVFSAEIIYDAKNPNEPYTFNAKLVAKNLVVDGKNSGDQTFVMSKAGKTLNLENNEGDQKALETSQSRDISEKCKITATGRGLSGRLTRLTHPAPCDFNLPQIVAGWHKSAMGEVPIGTYWRYLYFPSYANNTGLCFHAGGAFCKSPNGEWDVAHDFPYLDGFLRKDDLKKIPRVAGRPNETVSFDSGFLLAEPSGKVYLLADAGVSMHNLAWLPTKTIAKDLLQELKVTNSSLYKTNFVDLFRPTAETTFGKGSVIAIYDDTPDMGGTIDVTALTKYVVTSNIGLRWSTEEEESKKL